MLLGILSDTHGRAEAAFAGVRLLKDAGAMFFVHCGDVGSNDVLDALAGEQAAFVFGNCDWDRVELERYAAITGVRCLGTGDTLLLAGKRLFVTHGDDHRVVQRTLKDQAVDYLLVGHSHIKADERMGKVRTINPGALHRAAVKTVALLDLESDNLRFLVVP